MTPPHSGWAEATAVFFLNGCLYGSENGRFSASFSPLN